MCNLCPNISKCRLDKYFDYAKQTHTGIYEKKKKLKKRKEPVNYEGKNIKII